MINYILREGGQKRTLTSTQQIEKSSNLVGGAL
jgi:hypothetical protein